MWLLGTVLLFAGLWYLIFGLLLPVPWYINVTLLLLYCFTNWTESTWFRSLGIWKRYQSWYHPITFKGEGLATLKNKEVSAVYGMHPHGVYPICVDIGVSIHSELLHIKPVAHSILFRVPIVKDFVSWVGAIHATRDEMKATLKQGHSLIVCPGGLNEIPGWEKEPIHPRKGFLEVAKEMNVPVVPIWSEGEPDAYRVYHFSWLRPVQNWFLKKIRYPFPVICLGNPKLPFWPKPVPIEIRVGLPIPTNDKSIEILEREFYAAIDKLKS